MSENERGTCRVLTMPQPGTAPSTQKLAPASLLLENLLTQENIVEWFEARDRVWEAAKEFRKIDNRVRQAAREGWPIERGLHTCYIEEYTQRGKPVRRLRVL